MKMDARSIVVGRKPRVGENEFKTAFIKVYMEHNPLSITDFPQAEPDFENIEKITFNKTPTYFLEGNDLVFDQISGFEVTQDGTTLHIDVN